jgi:hypothetical protein
MDCELATLEKALEQTGESRKFLTCHAPSRYGPHLNMALGIPITKRSQDINAKFALVT